MKVLFAASEAVPFVKTGGLADVSGALPAALKDLGVDVRVFLPFYNRLVDEKARLIECAPGIYEAEVNGVRFYFIRNDAYFDREGLYGNPDCDYADNLERFAFFSRATLEATKALEFRPDVIHCNDWQTGLIPAYLRDSFKRDPFFKSTATLFTVHNLAFHGFGTIEAYPETGLSPEFLSPDGLEFYGRVSQLKSGLSFSDVITTVSETYAKEIRTPELGFGLDGLLNHRSDSLFGVLNGVDVERWNPARDPDIAASYSSNDLAGKKKCKEALLREFKLEIDPDAPLIGVVSRLTEQKGWELFMEAEKEITALDFSLALLGTGDKKMEEYFTGLARRFPKRVSARICYDERLAHMVEAGADIFLMPSRYEPCGLNQIYSLIYGTVPIVRATGGLNDTVRDVSEERANGFKFADFSAAALVAKLAEATSLFKCDKSAWQKLSLSSMDEDFSWTKPARRYAELYATSSSRLLNNKAPNPQG
jgi:starch synthase